MTMERTHKLTSPNKIGVTMEKVKAQGGKIIGGASGPDKIDDIPGIGRYISFEDSEGNHVGMLQPAPRK